MDKNFVPEYVKCINVLLGFSKFREIVQKFHNHFNFTGIFKCFISTSKHTIQQETGYCLPCSLGAEHNVRFVCLLFPGIQIAFMAQSARCEKFLTFLKVSPFSVFFSPGQVLGPTGSDTVAGLFNFLSKYPVQFNSSSLGIYRPHHEGVVTPDTSRTTHFGR